MSKPGLAMDDIHQGPVEVVADDHTDTFFRNIHGRTLNTLNKSYLLPVDQDEVKVGFSHIPAPIYAKNYPLALGNSSPFGPVPLQGQKLCRPSQRGTTIWSTA